MAAPAASAADSGCPRRSSSRPPRKPIASRDRGGVQNCAARPECKALSGPIDMSAVLSAFGGEADIRESRCLLWSDANDPSATSTGLKFRSVAVACAISFVPKRGKALGSETAHGHQAPRPSVFAQDERSAHRTSDDGASSNGSPRRRSSKRGMRVGGQQARCTRRKKTLWLVASLLPSQPPLSAYRALLLPMPRQLASSKPRKTSSLSLTSDIQTGIRVKLVHAV